MEMCYRRSRDTVACSAIVIGRMLHDRGGNSITPNTNSVYAVLAHNVCTSLYCCIKNKNKIKGDVVCGCSSCNVTRVERRVGSGF